ncbi:hypothetical protein H8S23_04795 [Anaerofilum sp. BX8]|uniref:Uncharacterized protein n=1 Tax=Anaerofilum hominis TaxID=2763016 RepID=A0A923ID24_9FIRM|nr:hypothetical protein [Anaerofilum hominis]MBC5580815.1 hypothetical protein [Anaerofilum hominis]
MEKENSRMKQTVKFLKWIRQYSGWWYLICTPNDKHMNPEMMKMLMERLDKAALYELIFVLIMVHRKEPFADSFIKSVLLDMLIARWDIDKEEIVKKFIEHLQ